LVRGNITSRRLRGGQVIGYGYDALGRLTAKDRPGSEPDNAYAHDHQGRLTRAAEGGHVVTLDYDALGRRVREVGLR
jgi:YD repeat-containing protein